MNRNIVYMTHATFLIVLKISVHENTPKFVVSTRIHPVCPREFTQKMSTRIHQSNVHENSPKMSTRIHLKSVHENSPIQRNSSGRKCPREGRESVHENSPLLSTKIPLLCPLEFFHPKTAIYYSQILGNTL